MSEVVWSINIPNKYTSSMLLMLNEDQQSQGIDSDSQFGALASLTGLGSGLEDKSSYVIEKLKSKDFSRKLMERRNFKKNLMASSYYDVETEELFFDEKIINKDNGQWLIEEPSFMEFHKALAERLRISKTDLGGFIKVSFSHLSPKFSYSVLQSVLIEINEEERKLDLDKSISAIEFLNSRLATTPQVEVRKSINNLIEVQLKTQMMSNIEKDYLVRPLDSPFIPEEKSSPWRSLIVLLAGILAFLTSSLLYSFQHIRR